MSFRPPKRQQIIVKTVFAAVKIQLSTLKKWKKIAPLRGMTRILLLFMQILKMKKLNPLRVWQGLSLAVIACPRARSLHKTFRQTC